uniref:Uncharacterized protein n=1 Tax=Ananas comosus var. bracteatus TaxID=296719 RepID=A0A6V7P551_ANACO|nr:unnamed protein product [Ananas comosus var. bracteatus]
MARLQADRPRVMRLREDRPRVARLRVTVEVFAEVVGDAAELGGCSAEARRRHGGTQRSSAKGISLEDLFGGCSTELGRARWGFSGGAGRATPQTGGRGAGGFNVGGFGQIGRGWRGFESRTAAVALQADRPRVARLRVEDGELGGVRGHARREVEERRRWRLAVMSELMPSGWNSRHACGKVEERRRRRLVVTSESMPSRRPQRSLGRSPRPCARRLSRSDAPAEASRSDAGMPRSRRP